MHNKRGKMLLSMLFTASMLLSACSGSNTQSNSGSAGTDQGERRR